MNKIIFIVIASMFCLSACNDDITAVSDNTSSSSGIGVSSVSETDMPMEFMCGNVRYNPMEKVCVGTMEGSDGEPIPLLLSLCGTSLYNPVDTTDQNELIKLALALLFESKQICRDGVVYGLCGENEYDVRTKFCYENKIYDFCDGQRYDPDGQICDNGKVRGVCGEKRIVYDFETQTCRAGKIYNWCGNVRYDPEIQSCLEQDSKP